MSSDWRREAYISGEGIKENKKREICWIRWDYSLISQKWRKVHGKMAQKIINVCLNNDEVFEDRRIS